MKISFRDHIPNENEQELLKEFLFVAIYSAPGEYPPGREILDDPKLAVYFQNWGRQGDHVLFAFYDEEVIGACWTRCFPKEQPGYGTISPDIPELSIAVLPKYRGKGVGTKLLRKILFDLQSEYQTVSLSVSANNPAKELYQRFGFVKYREENQSIIMIKLFSEQ